jgi:uncharacterized protein (TIGR02145 family)
MKNSTIIIFLVFAMLKTQAQDYLISFAGSGDTSVVGVVKIDNLTSGATVTLNGGDILHLVPAVGIDTRRMDNGILHIYPNPMTEHSLLTFVVPETGNAVISIVDLSGRIVQQISRLLSPGVHTFSVSVIRQGVYFVNVTGKNYNHSAKLISQGNPQKETEIEYVSSVKNITDKQLKSIAATIEMPYTDGDQLLFKGTSGIYSTIVTDVPDSSKTITFDFVACTDNDDNNYAIVEIGTQTWMGENLNVGTKINSTTGGYQQTDNDVIEKYCYNNAIANCAIYGGLYEWPEMMQYVTTEGVQGICPIGWHIPTDNEWKILEGTVDSQYPVGDPEWDQIGERGLDAGGNLKETGYTHWYSPNTGATNESGFTGLPAGYRYNNNGYFNYLGIRGYFWSSSQYLTYNAWSRYLNYYYANVTRNYNYKEYGFSVRCLKD